MGRFANIGTPAALALLLAAFLALRLPFLTDDLPAPLAGYYQDVASPLFDEGWWTANARHFVLTGRFAGTGLDLLWISPVFTAGATAAFAALGPTLGAARLAAVLAGAAGLVFLVLAGLPRRADPALRRTTLLAGALLAASAPAAHLSRLALPESAGTTLGLAAAWWLLRGPRAELGAGVLVGLALLAKPHFVFLVPAFLATAGVVARAGERPVAGAALRLAAGAAAPLLAWALVAAMQAAAVREVLDFYDMGRWITRPAEGVPALAAAAKPILQTLAVGVVYRHPVAAALPGLFVLAALALPRALTAGRVPPVVTLFGAWALCGGLLVAASPFQPMRYFVPLLPAWAFLAAWLVAGAGPPDAPSRGERALRLGIAALLGAQIAFAALAATLAPDLAARATAGDLDPLRPLEFHLTPFLLALARDRSLDAFAPLHTQQALIAALVSCGALAAGAGALAAPLLARALAPVFRAGALPPRIARVLLAALVLSAVLPWIPSLRNRARTIAAMGEDLARRLPPGAVVSPGGTYALGTPFRFDSDAVRRHARTDPGPDVTHVVALESHPWIGRVRDGGIAAALGAHRIAGYALTGGYVVGLYALDRPGTAP